MDDDSVDCGWVEGGVRVLFRMEGRCLYGVCTSLCRVWMEGLVWVF